MSRETGSDVYGLWGQTSPNCMRVKIALEEKGLSDYKHRLVKFNSKKTNRDAEVVKQNPRGQVPSTRFGDVVVHESLATVDYIEALYPDQGTRLHPRDPVLLAKVLQRKYEGVNLSRAGNINILIPIFQDKEFPHDMVPEFLDELSIWEGYLKEEGEGSYLTGKDFTMADVSVFPFLAFYVREGLKLLPRFPYLDAYYNKLCQRESVKKSWPNYWKITERPDYLSNIY